MTTSRRDEGSSTLVTVLLTPVFMVLALMAFQAAMWSHVGAEARAVARSSAALVARNGADPDATERSAADVLTRDADLVDPVVSIDISDGLVTARVTGNAPGIVRGTSSRLDIVEVVPIERFSP